MSPQKKRKKGENGNPANGETAPDVILELVEEKIHGLDVFEDMDSFADVKRGKTSCSRQNYLFWHK